MKKSLLMLVVMFFVFVFTSCQKEEVVNQISDSDRIEKIRKEMSLEKYLPAEALVLNLYDQNKDKNAGLKNGNIRPKAKVGFASPSNDIYLLPNGEFKKNLVWVIIENGYLVDEGIIITHYNQNYQQIGDLVLYIGWNNEYCVPVFIKSNFKNAQTRLNFSFPVSVGQFSFENFSNSQEVVEIWLPELNFDFSWETCGGASFGGLRTFNPYSQNEINIQIGGVFMNTNDYIRFNTSNIGINSKININVSDENGEWVDRTELIFPFGKLIPEYIMIPLTFKPNEVMYQITTFEGGRAVYSDNVIKKCVLMIPFMENQRIYGLK